MATEPGSDSSLSAIGQQAGVASADGSEFTLSSNDCNNSNLDNTQLNINTNNSNFSSFEHKKY